MRQPSFFSRWDKTVPVMFALHGDAHVKVAGRCAYAKLLDCLYIGSTVMGWEVGSGRAKLTRSNSLP